MTAWIIVALLAGYIAGQITNEIKWIFRMKTLIKEIKE